jgi:hypothetical protein
MLSNNLANGAGGGIVNVPAPTGTLTLVGSTLSQNSSGLNGGGIFNSGGRMTISATTLDNNSADNGGGIYNSGILTLTNSTLSQNQALAGHGGGLYNFGLSATTAKLTNATLTLNQAASTGGGLYNDGGTITLLNTIAAEQATGVDCFNNIGAIVDGGHNLDSDASCGLTPPSISAGHASLGPLQNNGGATQTHALLSDSQALDAGNNSGCPTWDQRGVIRPLDGNSDGTAVCDIGAFELETYFSFIAIILSDGP